MTHYLPYEKSDITGGFWKDRQLLNRKTTIWNVYKRFKETGRFDAFRMDWKEGMPNKPHYFWDSDVAKWLESVAYLTMKQREPELEAIVDEVVGCIERGQDEDGYFNIYFQLFCYEERFRNIHQHELYCCGHLLEAAIAYDQATGRHKFLDCMKKYAAYVKKRFMDEQSTGFRYPGHEEIEIALIKLYDYTGDKQWLDLVMFFLNERGLTPTFVNDDPKHRRTNIQAHLPVREQFTAEGHAVRAGYLYSAMADAAVRTGDEELRNACEKIFDNIITSKMYVTGAVGSTRDGEAFEENFRLPNRTAYAETCANLSLALFARRMECIEPDAKYADTVERVIYNAFLSGTSLDGKAFFYSNLQEIDLTQRRELNDSIRDISKFWYPATQRVEVFSCSCCPPNVTRFVASIADFLYNYTDDTIYVNQYMESTSDFGQTKLSQKTGYPYDGKIAVTLTGEAKKLALRIPGWCDIWEMRKNGARVAPAVEKGYAFVDAADGDVITLELRLEVRRVSANPRLLTDRGMKAVMWGPFVMCMEGVDNGGSLYDVRLVGKDYTPGFDEELKTPVLYCPAERVTVDNLYSDKVTATPFTARLIPYFAFANRGETDMRIWFENV